ncbi:MAG: hypothetical protein ACLGPL_00460 [Acidobacteriota bacterium]
MTGRTKEPNQAHGEEVRTTLRECASTVEEMLDVLREEARILRRFDGKELIGLLPRKEFLVAELAERLSSLRKVREEAGDDLEPIRQALGEVEDLNRSNRVFVEGTMDYWQGLLTILQPASYGPGMEDGARKAGAAYKGLAFRREV